MNAWIMGPRRALIALVKAYRLLLSPWLGNQCRFTPTCSVYAIEALQVHGAWLGSALVLRRIGRCGPWCAGGHDPVPRQLFTSLVQNDPGQSPRPVFTAPSTSSNDPPSPTAPLNPAP